MKWRSTDTRVPGSRLSRPLPVSKRRHYHKPPSPGRPVYVSQVGTRDRCGLTSISQRLIAAPCPALPYMRCQEPCQEPFRQHGSSVAVAGTVAAPHGSCSPHPPDSAPGHRCVSLRPCPATRVGWNGAGSALPPPPPRCAAADSSRSDSAPPGFYAESRQPQPCAILRPGCAIRIPGSFSGHGLLA